MEDFQAKMNRKLRHGQLPQSPCGYEYISAIMMHLLADLVKVEQKDKDKIKLEVRMILIGIVAFSMHAPLRGNGDLIAGIKKHGKTEEKI